MDLRFSCGAGDKHGLRFYLAGPETSEGVDKDDKPLPGVDKLVHSQFTRHYILPTCALSKGDPVRCTQGKAPIASVHWA